MTPTPSGSETPSALDRCLAWCDGQAESNWNEIQRIGADMPGEHYEALRRRTRETLKAIENGRLELAQLRSRVADLDLLLRAKLRGVTIRYKRDMGRWFLADDAGSTIYSNERGRALGWDWVLEVPDDGTGLPLLNDEARNALRGSPDA